MVEREPAAESLQRGELLSLWHPSNPDLFSGYGLTLEAGVSDRLLGLLMVDRPRRADPAWLAEVAAAYGSCPLYPMTATGERGLLCEMHIVADSVPFLRRMPPALATPLRQSLLPLLETRPELPQLWLWWEREAGLWLSALSDPAALPPLLHELFARSGPGCLAVQTETDIVHLCHAPDGEIAGFRNTEVAYQWQLVQMPTAPLIRLALWIHDRPGDPYRFESFLNVGDAEQLEILVQLAEQPALHLAFYGSDLRYRYSKLIAHTTQQWQQLDGLIEQALRYWESLPAEQRDFDRARADFMRLDAQ